jgi:hypothetical protein
MVGVFVTMFVLMFLGRFVVVVSRVRWDAQQRLRNALPRFGDGALLETAWKLRQLGTSTAENSPSL